MPELLFLAHRIPYPPNKGDKIRSWNVLRHLCRDFTVHLGCLIDDPSDWEHIPVLREICATSHFARLRPWPARLRSLRSVFTGEALSFHYFRDRKLGDWVDALHGERSIDVQFVYSSSMAPYAERQLGFRGLRIVDFGDVDSDKWAQYGQTKGGPARWIYTREARLLERAEQEICSRAGISLFVSEAEAEFFRQRVDVPPDRVRAMSNGVDVNYFSPAHELADPYSSGGPVLVFTGAMDYWANVDAVLWFRDEVLPLVRERVPDVRLAVVGSRPAAAVTRMAKDPGVIVTGRVDDVRPYLSHAAAAVAPLRIARGIQNKVLEAMAMAKAVAASPQAFEGIEATPGDELLVADGASAFAGAILELLGDSTLRERLGSAARQRVVESYGWEHRLETLDRVLEGRLGAPPAAQETRN